MEGPNAESLVEAQRARRRVRPPRDDEALDPGWRPFDPAVDWTEPALEGERWPADRTTLYYWRETYWNGDPARGAAAPREATNSDRLVAHLRLEVPEALPVIESLEWQYGEAHAHRVCSLLAAPARAAFGSGDPEGGLRIVRGVAAGLDEGSDTYVPNAVTIGFLEDHAWLADDLALRLAEWPEPMRSELDSQRRHRDRAVAAHADQDVAWKAVVASARGRPVPEVVADLRDLRASTALHGHPETELGLELTARALIDPHWVRHHPVDSLHVAWRFRSTSPPLRTLRSLVRARFAG